MRHLLDRGDRRLDTAAVSPIANNPNVESAREVAIEVLGQLAEFWGFTRTMGRIFGSLYLSPKPLSQAELSESLGISAASVSLSINGLVRWGAVRKARVPGSRKLHYESETEFRRIVTSVLESRERNTLEEAADAIAHALDKIQKQREAGEPLDESAAFVLERLTHLESVYRISHGVLKALIRTGSVEFDSLAATLGLSRFSDRR